MSDQDNDKPQPPSKKTSSVPLKKETVRVTLKADPDQPSAAPKAPDTAASTPGAPPTPTAPGPPKPPTAAGPPKPPQSGDDPPKPSPAPTVPLNKGQAASSPSVPKPAPTIPLKTGPSESGSPAVSLNTGKKQAPAENGNLPKATMKLDKTQPLPPPSASATESQKPTINTVAMDDDDEETHETVPAILSIISFVLALFVLGLGLSTWLATGSGHEIGDLFN